MLEGLSKDDNFWNWLFNDNELPASLRSSCLVLVLAEQGRGAMIETGNYGTVAILTRILNLDNFLGTRWQAATVTWGHQFIFMLT